MSFEESALSVEEAAGTLRVTVVLSQTRTEATTLTVITTAVTASAHADYDPGPYSVTIAAGATEGTVDITIMDDATPESAETFFLALAGPPTGVTLGAPSTATVTINANTEAPQARFSAAAWEAWEGAGATVTVELSEGSASETTVTLTAQSTSTATAGTDYAAGPWTVTIAAGATSGTVDIETTQDNVLEANGEYIGLTISGVSANVTIGTPSAARVNILDDEYTFCFTETTYTVAEDAGHVEAVITLSRALRQDTDFRLTYLDLNAEAGKDYTRVHHTAATALAVPRGRSRVPIRIPILGDDETENSELFRISVAEPALPVQHDGTPTTDCTTDIFILRNDAPTVSIEADVSKVAEGTAATYTLTAVPAPESAIDVHLDVADAPGADYVDAGDEGAVTVSLGTSGTASVTVTTRADSSDEPDGPVTVTVTADSGPVLSHDYWVGDPSSASVTVTDDGGLPATVASFAQAASSAVEGAGTTHTVTVDLSPVSAQALTLAYTVGGTATEGADFTIASSGTVQVPANTASADITVTVRDDEVAERPETVVLTLDAGTGYRRGRPVAHTLTLADDADRAGLVFTPSALHLTEGGAGASYTVRLASRPWADVTVAVRAPSGTDLTVDTDAGTAGAQRLLTFTPSSWRRAQTVTVSAGADADTADDRETLAHQANGGGYVALGAGLPVTVADVDDPTANFTSPSGTHDLPEGAERAFTLVLTTPLTAFRTVTWLLDLGGTAGEGTDYTLRCGRAPGVTCRNLGGNAPALVVDGAVIKNYRRLENALFLSAAEDGAAESRETVTLSLGDRTLTVGIVDAPAATTIEFGGATGTISERHGPYQPVLSASPPFGTAITVPVTVSGTATAGEDYVAFSSFTIPAGKAAVTPNIDLIDDLLLEGNETVVIAIDTAGLPAGVSAGTTATNTLTIHDDERAGFVLTPSALNVAEGASGRYTVALASEPKVDVTVSVASDNGDVTVDTDPNTSGNQATLTFTTANWYRAQPVAVAAAADGDGTDDTAALAHTASGGGYGSAAGTVTVTVAEPASTVVAIVPDAASVTEGTAAAFTLTATPAPTVALEVTLRVDDAPHADFVAAADQGAKTVRIDTTGTARYTVPTGADGVDEPSGPVTVTVEAGSGYLPGAPASVAVADDDPTEVVLTVPDAYASERDASDTAALVLTLGRALIPGERLAVPLGFAGGSPGTDFTLARSGAGSHRNVEFSGTTVQFVSTLSNTGTRATVLLTALADADSTDDTVTVSIPASEAGAPPVLAATRLDGGATGSRTGDGEVVLGELRHEVSVRVAADAPEGDAGTTDHAVTFSVTPARAAGNAFHLDICLTGAASHPASRPVAGRDYDVVDRHGRGWAVGTNGCLTIDSVATVGQLITDGMFIRVNGDTDVEDDETVTVTLKRRTGATRPTPVDVAVSATGGSATYTIENDDALHALIVSPTTLSVREHDGEATYTLRPRTAPGGTVTVTPTSGDPAKVAVSGAVSFDDTDWETAKTVTVTGKGAAGETATVTHAVTAGTTDYPTGLEVDAVEVTVSADTRPVVRLTTSSAASVAEGDTVPDGQGGTTQAPVALDLSASGTLAADLAVGVTVTQEGAIARAGDVGTRTLTIPRSDGVLAATVGIDDDAVDEPNGAVTATLEPGAAYRVSDTASTFTTVLVDDDPTAVALARTGSGAVAEGETATLTVTLGRRLHAGEEVTAPLAVGGTGITAGDYTLALSPGGGLNDGVTLDTTAPHGAAEPAVVFTGDDTDTVRVATLTLAATEDGAVEETPETLSVGFGTGARTVSSNLDRASGTGTGGTTPTGTASVEIAADATPGLVLSVEGLEVAEGASGTFTVALRTEPTGPVTVTLASDNADVTVDTDGATDGNQRTLTFRPSGSDLWSTAQAVTVAAAEDADLADEGATLTLTASGGGYGAVGATLDVTVHDSDAPTLNIAQPGPGVDVTGVPEGATFQFNAFLGRALEADETATYRLAFGGTATRGADYRLRCVSNVIDGVDHNAGVTCANLDSGAATVTFDGAQTLTESHFTLFEMELLEDSTAEPKETATLRVGSGRFGSLTIGIVDAPSSVTVSFAIADYSWAEGNGPGALSFRITPASGRDIEVPLTLTGVTATAGVDFESITSATIPAGKVFHSAVVVIPDDDVAEGDETFTAAIDTASLPQGVTAGSITVATFTILDGRDQTGLVLTPSALEVAEGTDGRFTVRLRSEPTADVTVTVSGHAGTDVTVDTDSGTAGDQDTLTFTPATWNTAQPVTVSAAADDDTADDAVTLALAASGADYGAVSATLAVTVRDVPPVPFLSVSDATVSEATATQQRTAHSARGVARMRFRVSLSAPLAHTVRARAVTRESTPVSARTNRDFPQSQFSLTFGPGETERHVYVRIYGAGINGNEAVEGPETFELVLEEVSGAPVGDGVGVGTITEGPMAPGVAVSRTRLAMGEGGGTVSYSVALDAPPGPGETVTVTVSTQDAGAVQVLRPGARSWEPPQPAASRVLRFGGGERWSRPQTVTLAARDDDDIDDERVTVTHTVSGPGGWGAVSAPSLEVTVADDDDTAPPLVSIAPGASPVTEGTDAAFTVSVNEAPGAALKVAVEVADAPGGDFVARGREGRRTVTIGAGQRSAVFTVPTHDDAVVEADGAVTATLGAGAGYGLGATVSASVTVADDDGASAGVAVSGAALALVEGGAAGTYTVALAAPPGPGETVTVTATVVDPAVAQVRAGSGSPGPSVALAFTGADWSSAQTVTVSPRDDADTANESTQITHAVSGPGAWAGVAAPAVAVTVNDDDTAPLPTVSIAAEFPGSAGAEGTPAGFVVTADPAPAANLAVKVTVADAPGADYIASAREGVRTVTIQAGATSATFRIPTQADTDDDANGAVTATLGAGSGYVVHADDGTAGSALYDDDATTVVLAGPVGDIAEADGEKTVTVTLGRALVGGEALEVPLVFDGTATRGEDYAVACADATGLACSGLDGAEPKAVFTGVAGAARGATLTLASVDDTADEGAGETVTVALGTLDADSGTGLGGGATGSGTLAFTITDDDVPAVSIAPDATGPVTEGTAVGFTLTVDPAPAADLAVKVTVADAAAGSDFLDAADEGEREVAVLAGATSAAFTVATEGDTDDEPNGAVTATLGDGDGYTVDEDAGAAAAALADDDATTVTLAGTPSDIAEADGVKTFTVTLGRALVEGEALEVPLVFAGVATRGEDYTVTCASAKGLACTGLGGASPKAAFTGGAGVARVATLTLASVDDPDDEGAGETVTVALGTLDSTSGTGLGGGASGTGALAFTITDDDLPPPVVTLAVSPTAMTEGGTATFTLSADRAPDAALQVAVTVTDAPGADYIAQGEEGRRTVTIGAGSRTAAFTLRTPDDAVDEPDGPVTATLAAGDGYTLGSSAQASVMVSDDDEPTLPSLTIEDAEAEESARNMRFTIRLSAPLDRAVHLTVRFQESDPVSARASWDWRTRTFCQCAYDFIPNQFHVVLARGETVARRGVGIADDAHDEGDETFEGRITWADVPIADGVAVGTIRNDDPLPAAWLARFGRTVAQHALDGIAERIAADRTPGMQGTLAGQALPGGGEEDEGGAADGRGTQAALAGIAQAFGGDAGRSGATGPFGEDISPRGRSGEGLAGAHAQDHSMTGREALVGSRFALTGEKDAAGGSLALWGRAAAGRFDGVERGDGTDIRLDGEVTTAMLGADYARDRWLVGLALARSEGEGTYESDGDGGCPPDADGAIPVLCDGAVRAGDGTIDGTLSAAIPYAAVQASERLKVWGAAGYGTGEVTLETMGVRLGADTTWTMAAAGLRGELLAPSNGPSLALTSDAMWARTSSEKTRELAASGSDVTRLRLGLEGGWPVALDAGASLTPTLETGLRHDGGDAETGFGVELGAGLAWSDPARGLSLELSGRTLLAHEDRDLEDRGYAASLAYRADPATARGLSLSFGQTFGAQASGGLDALFAPDPLAERTGAEAASRWTAEAAYGLPALGGRFTGSPHAGFGLSPGSRELSVGWRLTPEGGTAPDLSLDLKAVRRESDAAGPEHTVGVELRAAW